MTEKLQNVNIECCSYAELIALRSQTRPAYNLHTQVNDELIRQFDNYNQTCIPEITKPAPVTIANNRKLPETEPSYIIEDVYDIILDMPANSLRYRKDPASQSSLQDADLKGIGSHRIKILAYMLEHPGDPFHANNIYRAYTGPAERVAPNTFTKTIGTLRKSLGQNDTTGPYIVKQFDWDGITDRKQGYVYQMSSEWRYLVIRRQEDISEQIPS